VIVDVAGAHPFAVDSDGQLALPLNKIGASADGLAGVMLMIAVGVSPTAGGADVGGRSVTETCGVVRGPKTLSALFPVVPTILPRMVTTLGDVLVAAGGR